MCNDELQGNIKKILILFNIEPKSTYIFDEWENEHWRFDEHQVYGNNMKDDCKSTVGFRRCNVMDYKSKEIEHRKKTGKRNEKRKWKADGKHPKSSNLSKHQLYSHIHHHE